MTQLLQDQNQLAFSYHRSASTDVGARHMPYFVFYRLEALRREESQLRGRSPSSHHHHHVSSSSRPSTPPPQQMRTDDAAGNRQPSAGLQLSVPCDGCGRVFASKSLCKVHESRCPALQDVRETSISAAPRRSPSRSALQQKQYLPNSSFVANQYPHNSDGEFLQQNGVLGNHSSNVLDVSSIPLKPPGAAAAVNYSHATFDENSGGGILAKATAPMATVACSNCGRRFNEDRISAHRKACLRAEAAAKRRTAFDVRQQRVEALVEANHLDPALAQQILAETSPSPDRNDSKKHKGKWRQQSAALQQTMRASRGIAPDPGQPQVVEDRVLCNGCGRRFAPDTAERHIPNCVAKARK